MPRTSIRSLTALLLGLTSDAESDTPPVADEISLVERLGDSRLQIRPARRPKMGGGADTFTAAATTFSVVQIRAGPFPVYVRTFSSNTVLAASWRVGADLIEAARAASATFWRHPPGGAIVEHGQTAAVVIAQPWISAAGAFVEGGEHYLEPGEVLSFHHQTAATALSAAFNWYEVA